MEPGGALRGQRAPSARAGYQRTVEHPLLQVEGYCDTIVDFVGALDGDADAVRGVAYPHNAADPDVHDLLDLVRSERTRLFTKTRRGAFLDYLRASSPPNPARAPPIACSTALSARPSS